MERDFFSLFRQIIDSYAPVTLPVIKLIYEKGSFDSFSKNELVFAEKKFNAFEYFQLTGISHRFNMDENNSSVTTGIYADKTVITPHFARTINSQSIFSLQVLSDSTFLKVPIGSFDELRNNNEQVKKFGQSVVEKEFIQSLNHEVLFRSHTAKDRLMFFRTNYPALENLIPHTIIASFLGITPVSFSRLRNELTRAT